MIKIRPQLSQDGEIISCSSINSASTQVKTSQVSLRLIFKPIVSLVQTNRRVLEGDKVLFRCSVKAWPLVSTIAWFLGNKPLVEETSEFLALKKLTREQHGMEVKCVAMNKVGVGQGKAQLNIICK